MCRLPFGFELVIEVRRPRHTECACYITACCTSPAQGTIVPVLTARAHGGNGALGVSYAAWRRSSCGAGALACSA